ncbi:MAG TPA: M67 family metallopeptidase [Pyrinomonadaceae bacterium]
MNRTRSEVDFPFDILHFSFFISSERAKTIVTLRRAQLEEMYAQAREASPSECCGLIGGRDGVAETVYPLRNVAAHPHVRYEAALDDLIAAPKLMRERGEQLIGIYHSHPQSDDPTPSETDVRLAYYPEAVYFIIGFRGEREGVLRAFHIFEREGRWERISFQVIED